jgi:hypothetical protein
MSLNKKIKLGPFFRLKLLFYFRVIEDIFNLISNAYEIEQKSNVDFD